MLVRKVYETKEEKRRDLIIGVVGFFVINGVLVCSSSLLGGLVNNSSLDFNIIETITFILACIPFLINIGLIIYFAFTRAWIALGMLAALAVLFALAIVAGIFLTIACFVMLAGSH